MYHVCSSCDVYGSYNDVITYCYVPIHHIQYYYSINILYNTPEDFYELLLSIISHYCL